MAKKRNIIDEAAQRFSSDNFAARIDDTPISAFVREDNGRYMQYTVEERAIPSAIDGTKPGQRRLLYSMLLDGVVPGAKSKKSARLVNNATGQFHPHGGTSMYGTLVSSAVEYHRVNLVEGIGSFGRAPGSEPAQDRYTEARLSPHGFLMVKELKDQSVPFQPTYDGETTEPLFLSAQFPFLLINGSDGISEGYRSSTPAHNPREVLLLCQKLLHNPDMDDEEIFTYLPGPDWATGGSVIGSEDEVRKYMTTGRGKLTCRGTYSIDQKAKTITITEVPPGVSVQSLHGKLFKKASSGAIEGIKDLQNLSDRTHPIQIKITAKRGVDLEDLAKRILVETELETTFGVSMVALTEQRAPKYWNIRDLCLEFLRLRERILISRTKKQIEKAQESKVKAEALAAVLVDKETTVRIVMDAEDEATAAKNLAGHFSLSEEQGAYVSNLPIKRLSKSSVLDAQKDVEALSKKLEDLQKILDNTDTRNSIISKELEDVEKNFVDPRFNRKTQLRYDDVPTTLKETKEDTLRRLYSWKLDADSGILSDQGTPIPDGHHIWAVFTNGNVKIFNGAGLPKNVTPTTIAPDVSTMVACGTVNPADTDATILFVSSSGKVLRVPVEKINPQGRAGSGMAGMKLDEDEHVIYAAIGTDTDVLLTVSIDGWKVTRCNDIPPRGRNTRGITVHKLRRNDTGVYTADIAPQADGFIIEGKKAKISGRETVTNKAAISTWEKGSAA